uniref:Serine aminopeptidase S33 domain-containing protein n=1 Tax=Daucus carota subsp. sativus TaxID=79200 RepID=A0A164ZH61_DAUCS
MKPMESLITNTDDLVTNCTEHFSCIVVADDIKPNQMVRSVLAQLARIRSNPYCYKGVPRLQTGFQLMQTTSSIEKILPEVLVPFLVVRDEADKVTDPAVSKLLFETASSSDKTIKSYPGLGTHSVTESFLRI